MPEVPTYRNISTPGFTRTPTAPADTQVQRALVQAGGVLSNIGTKILGDFKKKQEISQYSTAQTDAIVAMNNLQAELLQNADYTKHEELAIEAKDSIRTDAMRRITEPEAQAAFDRWFGKAYEQLEQSVVVNAIGAGKRDFAAKLEVNLEKASLMPLDQGEEDIRKLIADAFIAGIPQDVLTDLQDDALHDLQLNNLRRATNIKTAQAQEDFGAIEEFINDQQESTRYAKLDANDWANVKSQAKSDFNFNKGLREDAEKKAREKSRETFVTELFHGDSTNLPTELHTNPKYNPLNAADIIQFEGLMKAVAAGSGDGGQPNFVNPEWHVKWLKMLADPRVSKQEKEVEWERAVNDGLITGRVEIEDEWNNIAKNTSNQAAEDGMDLISDAFETRKSNFEGKKRKRDELAELQKIEQEIYLMYTKDVYEHPEWTAAQITNHAQELLKPLEKRFTNNMLIAYGELLNATIAGEPTLPVEPEEPAKKPGGRLPAEPLPEPKTNNAKREEFERLTGVKLSSISGNIDSGTDPVTKEVYEIYEVGRKSWRWYNSRWQRLTRKGWVDDIKGPEPK